MNELGRVQQLTGRIGRAIGTTYVRHVSCWSTFILIQWRCHFVLLVG